MKAFVAGTAKALKVTDVIHFVSVVFIIEVMCHQSRTSAAATASPVSVAFYLQ